jgi:hypothetical protein
VGADEQADQRELKGILLPAASAAGRIEQVGPPFVGPPQKHLLLLLALELLIVKVGGAALVGGELAGHGV